MKIKLLTVTLLAISIIFLSSKCNDKVSLAPSTPPAPARGIETKLDVLYLENTAANSELETLIRKAKKEKIILQFYHRAADVLSLGAWPAKKKNQSILAANVVILHNLTSSILDISGQDVYLGDQQIPEAVYKQLSKIINPPPAHQPPPNPPYPSYIIFTPVVDNGHVVYDIGTATSLQANFRITPLGRTNPSPPFDAK